MCNDYEQHIAYQAYCDMMQAEALSVRPDVGAVLHASPFHATLVACSELELDTAAKYKIPVNTVK